jgi:hypothetical protein
MAEIKSVVVKKDDINKIGLFMPNGEEIPYLASIKLPIFDDKNCYGSEEYFTVTVEIYAKNELFRKPEKQENIEKLIERLKKGD